MVNWLTVNYIKLYPLYLNLPVVDTYTPDMKINLCCGNIT